MNRGGKKNGGRNHKFFESLTPLQNGLNAVYKSTPKVSSVVKDEDDAKAKQAAKLARRAKRAGH